MQLQGPGACDCNVLTWPQLMYSCVARLPADCGASDCFLLCSGVRCGDDCPWPGALRPVAAACFTGVGCRRRCADAGLSTAHVPPCRTSVLRELSHTVERWTSIPYPTQSSWTSEHSAPRLPSSLSREGLGNGFRLRKPRHRRASSPVVLRRQERLSRASRCMLRVGHDVQNLACCHAAPSALCLRNLSAG